MANTDADTHISIPVGITIGLLASFIQSLGLTIQRKSHVQNQALPEDQRRVEHRRPQWLLGFGIFISSNLFGSIFQIASLPVVILAPLGAVSLLWNAFFARILLGDAFSVWMVIGTLLISGGAVLIAVFGTLPEPTRSIEDLLVLFNRPAFIAYFSLLGLFVVVSLAITHIVEYSYSRRIALPISSPPLSPLLVPNSAPTVLTTAATPSSTLDSAAHTITERTPLLNRKASRASSPSPTASISSSSTSGYTPYVQSSSRTPLLLAMSYASFCGIMSGMCLLFAKSGVQLLVLTIGGKNQFWRWQAWMLVLGLGICALLQLWYMHKGLVLANPTLVCPLAFCLYNLSSILNGLVYFDQFALLSTAHLLLIMLGISILLAGVWIVSFPPGGGISVDVGLYEREGLDDSFAEVLSEDDGIHEVYDDEPLPMVTQKSSQSYSRPLSSDVEQAIVLDSVTPTDNERGRSYASLHIHTQPSLSGPASYHPRSQTDSVLSSHSFPSAAAAPSSRASSALISPTSPTTTSTTRRSRLRATSTLPASNSLTHHTSPRQSYPYPLSPGATPGTLAGFSIGLSPASPGFALVPRERARKRRITGSGVDHEAAGAAKLIGGGVMRRVVSDGDVGSPQLDDGADGNGALSEVEDGRQRRAIQGGSGGDRADTQQAGKARHAKGRWKWLGGIFHLGK